MKRVIKTLGRIVGILLIVIAVILVLLIIKGKIDERRPYLTDNPTINHKSSTTQYFVK